MDSKWCPGCAKNLPVDQFHREARRKNGLASRCKACNSVKYAKYMAKLAANPAPPVAEKWCSSCQRTLSASGFTLDPRRPDGLQSQCKLCRRAGARRRTYGISREETIAMLEAQGHLCALCRGEFGERGFHVDHCHETLKIRGLLCFSCNAGLGLFQDDPERLWAAVEYLTL